MRRTEEFMALCRVLPVGHWHCVHGHVVDCPVSPTSACPRLVDGDEPKTYAILVGRIVWLFASESLAKSQLQVLQEGGVAGVMYRRGLSALQVDALLAKVPEGVTVEDCR